MNISYIIWIKSYMIYIYMDKDIRIYVYIRIYIYIYIYLDISNVLVDIIHFWAVSPLMLAGLQAPMIIFNISTSTQCPSENKVKIPEWLHDLHVLIPSTSLSIFVHVGETKNNHKPSIDGEIGDSLFLFLPTWHKSSISSSDFPW